MKILYLITSSGIGGSEQHLLHLATWMSTQGFGVQVCSLREPGVIADQLRESGIDVLSFNEQEKPRLNEVVRSIFRLKRIIEDNKIDLVHSFLLRANLEARLASLLCSRRFTLINSERCINLVKPKVQTVLDQLTARSCDLFLANCNAVKSVLVNREQVPVNKVKVIHSGVDTGKFGLQPTRNSDTDLFPEVNGKGKLIGYVGRFHPEKGVRYLIEATSLLSHQTNNFRVVLVGDGSETSYLKQLVREHSLQNLIFFLGPRTDIAEILRRLDILVLPSTEEGLPTIVLEAFASGVPVVATAVGGTPEVNRHGETGFLVPPADPIQLAHFVQTLLRDEPLRKRFGVNARKLVEEKFKAERAFKETLQAYTEALARKAFSTPKSKSTVH